jgi:hypothetical protein
MISERMTNFIYRFLDTIFTYEQFNKDEFSDEYVYEIYSDQYKISIVKLLTRINVSADLFHKMHGLFGVSYGDLSDLIRDYLSDKLDYDFSNYPTVPSL